MSEWAESVEILGGFTNLNFELNLKVSSFYLEKQKSFIPKKFFFKPLSISKQKSFVYWLNFPEGFDIDNLGYDHTMAVFWLGSTIVLLYINLQTVKYACIFQWVKILTDKI